MKNITGRFPEPQELTQLPVNSHPVDVDTPLKVREPPSQHWRRDATKDLVPDPIAGPPILEAVNAKVCGLHRLERPGKTKRLGWLAITWTVFRNSGTQADRGSLGGQRESLICACLSRATSYRWDRAQTAAATTTTAIPW